MPLTFLFPVPFVLMALLLGWILGELTLVVTTLVIVVVLFTIGILHIGHRPPTVYATSTPRPVRADPPPVQRPSAGPVTVTSWVVEEPTPAIEPVPLALPEVSEEDYHLAAEYLRRILRPAIPIDPQ
jgi:hypothetical protein